MLANANFGSIYRENRWMLSIGTYFSKDHHVLDIDLETTTCVFRVPKSAAGSNSKPEAYAPRRLALGPYHHLRPDLCSMQLHKISRVRAFLGPENLEVFKKVVAALARCEPLIRACYDDFLDFDAMTLATILAVDALYLLHCFLGARKTDEIDEQMNVVVQNAADFLMLENQIPLVLLTLALEILQLHEIVGASADLERVLSAEFLLFCRRHSPLELTESDTEQLHLLDFMYRSIVVSRGDGFDDQISIGCGFADNAQIVERAKKIREQLKGAVASSTTPTASELSESAGVRFEGTPGGIMDITYDVNGKILQLPRIRLDGNSETVLRNLVAYEESAPARRGEVNWISEYVDLMCGLICGNEDVVVLKKAGIVVGEVSDEEIFGVFDGMRKSGGGAGGGMRRSSYIAVVGKSYDDVGCCTRFAKKGIKVAWQFVIFLASAATLLILLVQAFCSMFECRRWFQSSAPLPSLRILYSD